MRTTPVLVSMVLLLGCGATAANQAVADRIAFANDELFNKGNVTLVRGIFAPDYVDHSASGDVRVGPAEIERFVSEVRTAFPDLHVEVKVLAVHGDTVAWLRTHRGTHKAAFMGVPASGRLVVWREMIVTRYEADKIAEELGRVRSR